MKAFLLSLFLIFSATILLKAQNYWEFSNGPYSGDVQCFAFDSSGNFFAGTPGGVYKSNDNGNHWKRLGLYNVNYIGISPRGEIYTGTFEGIYKSTDNGISWQRIIIGSGFTFTHSILFPDDSTIYIGTDGGFFFSRNSGLTWNHRNTGYISSLVINNNGDIYAGTSAGVSRSSDKGDTWQPVFQLSTIRDVAVTANDSGYIFAGIYYANQVGWIYRSKNNGANWTKLDFDSIGVHSMVSLPNGKIAAGTETGVFFSSDNGNSWGGNNLSHTRVNSLMLDRNGNLFAGTYFWGVYRSSDSGSNWVQANEGLDIMPVYCFAINGNDIYAGTYMAGVFRSTDNGSHWKQVGLAINTIFSLFVNKNGDLYAGSTIDGKIFRSTNKGDTWSIRAGNLDGVDCFAADSSGILYAGMSGQGLYRSTDNGITWREYSNFSEHYISSLALNNKGNLIAGTSSGIFLSTNSGGSWTRKLTASYVESIVTSRGIIFAAASQGPFEGGVYRSTDNGETWSTTNQGLTDKTVRGLTVNSKNQLFAGTNSGIFVSYDSGAHWTAGNTGLTSFKVSSLISAVDNNIYVATIDSGIFRSTDFIIPVELSSFTSTVIRNSVTLNWSTESEKNNSGFEVQRKKGNSSKWEVLKFIEGSGTTTERKIYSFKDNYLSPGIYQYSLKQIDYDGSYKFSSSVEAEVMNPGNFTLLRSYPNPFNPSAVIEAEIPLTEAVEISLYNILGQKVDTIFKGELDAGNHKFTFDADIHNLAAGVYICTLHSKSGNKQIKMILLK